MSIRNLWKPWPHGAEERPAFSVFRTSLFPHCICLAIFLSFMCLLSAFVSTKLVLKYLFQVIEVLLSEERFSPCLYVYSKFTFFAAFHHGAHEQALHFSSMLYKMPTAYESFQWERFLPVCIWEACISLSLT